MQSRRTVPRITRPDPVVPGPAGQAVRVPPDRVPATLAVIAAAPPARAIAATRPRATQVTLPDGWPVVARPAPSPQTPPPQRPALKNAPPKSPPPRTRAPKRPRRAAWPLAACLGALVVPAAIVVVLALRAGGSSLPEEVLFGSMTSPATGEPATSAPGLSGSGAPFVDPGLAPRVTKGGKAHWAPGYPGLPGFFIPPPSAARPGAGRHRSHRGLGHPGNGNGGGHPGQGPTQKPTHSPGGSRGGTPTPKPPSKTPKPVHSSPTTTPTASKPPASTPPASTPPPAPAPPATKSPSPRR
jgi:hypothetical protein